MPQENTNPLPPEVQQMLAEQLRDVHLPEAISWWPLAWGWWVVLAVSFLVIAASLLAFSRKRAKNRYRGFAISELQTSYDNWAKNQNNQAYLYQANDILKRCVLHASGTSTLTTQSGQAWVKQLNEWGKRPLTEKAQNALGFECYQANPSSDIKTLHSELVHWLKTHEYRLDNEPSTNLIKRGQHA